MTAAELLADTRARNPGMRFAVNSGGTALAVWTGERWEVVAAQMIGDANGTGLLWCRVRPGELNVCANGIPVFAQDGWIE